MKPLEEELRDALRRREPPPGFSARVMARLRGANPERAGWLARLGDAFARPRLRWAAVATLAAALLAGGGVEYYRYRKIQAEGEAAKAQLKLAIQIAASKLNAALRQLDRSERDRSTSRPRRERPEAQRNSLKRSERL